MQPTRKGSAAQLSLLALPFMPSSFPPCLPASPNSQSNDCISFPKLLHVSRDCSHPIKRCHEQGCCQNQEVFVNLLRARLGPATEKNQNCNALQGLASSLTSATLDQTLVWFTGQVEVTQHREVRAVSGGDVEMEHDWLASMQIVWAKRTTPVNETGSAPSPWLIRHTTVRSNKASS